MRTANIAGIGLSLGAPAAAALRAPKAVWIGATIMAGICFLAAIRLHILEGRPETESNARLPLVDRLKSALSEGLALVSHLDPATPSLDALRTARAWQEATYALMAVERRDLAKRFLDAGEPIEERETTSLSAVNPAHWILDEQAARLKEIIGQLEAEFHDTRVKVDV